MLKQLIGYAIAGASLSAVLVGATQSAEAIATSTVLNAAGRSPAYSDSVTGGGALTAEAVLDPAGALNDITVSSSGLFSNIVRWRCPGDSGTGYRSAATNGTDDVLFSDALGLCPFFGGAPTSVYGVIDDI
jgi:hypothetical protein